MEQQDIMQNELWEVFATFSGLYPKTYTQILSAIIEDSISIMVERPDLPEEYKLDILDTILVATQCYINHIEGR